MSFIFLSKLRTLRHQGLKEIAGNIRHPRPIGITCGSLMIS